MRWQRAPASRPARMQWAHITPSALPQVSGCISHFTSLHFLTQPVLLRAALLALEGALAFKARLPAMGSHATALSGFTVDAASEGSEAPLAGPPAAATAAADRPVAAGAAALVQHASLIATRVLERWQVSGYSPEQDGEQLASLCFALQSTVGQRGRLSEADERSLFELASALWSASLQAMSAPGDMSAALERLGNELFALVDGDSDNTQDCARCEEGRLGRAGKRHVGW